MTTGTVLVADSLLQIGVVTAGQTVKTNDLAIGLRWLNRMLDSWANVRAMLYTTATETFTFVANQAEYTTAVLAGGARPVALNYMNITLSGVNYPCRLIVNQSWADIGYPPATGIPEVCYYDAAFPDGNMQFWPIPYSSALTCNVYTQRVLSGPILAATDVLLPPGYEKAIVDNLGMYLTTAYPGAPVPQTLPAEAKEGMRVLRVTNYTALVSSIGWSRNGAYPPVQFLPPW